MLALAVRVPLIDLRMLVTAILIQREVGGNLAEVLDNLGDVIRQRFTVHRQLRVHTAQGRLSGYVLAVLPIAVGLDHLHGESGVRRACCSPITLGPAHADWAPSRCSCIGFFWIRRIINIEI